MGVVLMYGGGVGAQEKHVREGSINLQQTLEQRSKAHIDKVRLVRLRVLPVDCAFPGSSTSSSDTAQYCTL